MFKIRINTITKEWSLMFDDQVVPGVKRWSMSKKKADKPIEFIFVMSGDQVQAEIVDEAPAEEESQEG